MLADAIGGLGREPGIGMAVVGRRPRGADSPSPSRGWARASICESAANGPGGRRCEALTGAAEDHRSLEGGASGDGRRQPRLEGAAGLGCGAGAFGSEGADQAGETEPDRFEL